VTDAQHRSTGRSRRSRGRGNPGPAVMRNRGACDYGAAMALIEDEYGYGYEVIDLGKRITTTAA
jgi:hypothetical protein